MFIYFCMVLRTVMQVCYNKKKMNGKNNFLFDLKKFFEQLYIIPIIVYN